MGRGVKVWDRLSVKYDRLWVQKNSLGPTRRKVIEVIKGLEVGDSFNLLDVGCGTGQFIDEIKYEFENVKTFGMDYSEGMLQEARNKNNDTSYFRGNICASIPKEFIEPESIDIVTCMHSFPYYPDKAGALMNIKAILKTGGYAIFCSASVNCLYEKFVMWFVGKTASDAEYLSKNDMRGLLAKEFVLVDEFNIRKRFFMPTICGFLVRKI
jgi:ubiquinone/menaquinone biosynthesis C-methylase UbiE